MSGNRFGTLFQYQSWGESHGPAIGCVVDGVPPRIPLTAEDIQKYLDMRKPGQSRFTTQRKEPDQVKILSGVFDGVTTGTPIGLIIYNQDARSKDYGDIKDKFRPGHADFTYDAKYGIRANVILPGLMDTPMAVDRRAEAWDRTREEVARERDAKIPLRGKMGTAWDVAYAALFLASDEANFITGAALPVDGGRGCRVG